MKYQYGYLVIGGGSAGLTSAGFAADLDISSALVEAEHIGGDCTWSGCVPSKALIHAAEEAKAKEITPDYAEVFKYVKKKIQDIYVLESPDVWEKKGVNVLLGRAEMVDEHTVKIVSGSEESIVTAKHICIATGAQPIRPNNIEGLFDPSIQERVWTYLEFWEQEALPKSMVVIGGGPIGAELAQACSRLGCSITIIASKLLPRECEAGRTIVSEVFAAEGIKVLNARATKVESVEESGSLRIHASNGEAVEADCILVAVGRSPVLPPGCEDLFKIGGSGGIIVDPKLKCILKSGKKSSSVSAAGDCIDGNYQFTHYAGKQGFYSARNALLVGNSKGMLPLEVPRATFTSPEIGSIGYTSVAEAVAAGYKNAEMLELHGEHIDRSVTEDAQDRTVYEIILSGKTTSAKILGANIVAPNAGEVLAPLCLAIKSKIPISDFADVIQPYPTYSFGLMQLLGQEVTRRFVKSSTASIGKALNFN